MGLETRLGCAQKAGQPGREVERTPEQWTEVGARGPPQRAALQAQVSLRRSSVWSPFQSWGLSSSWLDPDGARAPAAGSWGPSAPTEKLEDGGEGHARAQPTLRARCGKKKKQSGPGLQSFKPGVHLMDL